ncbi:MAG: lytic murein transglycosylase B [Sulfurovum sp.]|nr:lytic murein transglycosylase B [Sulfurovum sp.]
MKKAILFFLMMTLILSAKDYTKNPATRTFINKLVKKYHYKRADLHKLFSKVKVQKTALRAFIPRKQQKRRKDTRTEAQKAKARELYRKYGPWERYSRLKLSPSRVNNGIKFVKKYQDTFKTVEKKYGVPKEYIAAIIGIESNYGKNVGKYPVFDTLTTLSFEKNRRNKFFKKELMHFMHLCKTQKINPKNVYGSYAGAIGLGQFMPSNYEAYGVDFNGDGRVTLQRKQDAIASVANYFKKNGWRSGEPVATRVSYEGKRFRRYKTGYRKTYERKYLKGIAPKTWWDYKGKVRLIKLEKKTYDELWYGAKNFFVITRYNHSSYYAMAVHQLAGKIKEGLHED